MELFYSKDNRYYIERRLIADSYWHGLYKVNPENADDDKLICCFNGNHHIWDDDIRDIFKSDDIEQAGKDLLEKTSKGKK